VAALDRVYGRIGHDQAVCGENEHAEMHLVGASAVVTIDQQKLRDGVIGGVLLAQVTEHDHVLGEITFAWRAALCIARTGTKPLSRMSETTWMVGTNR
jgi:hypothetical protein